MSRLGIVAARYARSARLVRCGVGLDLVGDPTGARVNAAVQEVLVLGRDNTSGLLDDVLGAAKALRWRLITQPQPVECNPALRQAAADVEAEADRLHAAVGPQMKGVLDELVASAQAAVVADPIAGDVLLKLVQEKTPRTCVIIAASGPAGAGLESWLGPMGFQVKIVGQLIREQLFVESGYAVGPPRFFPASVTNAPMTEKLDFIFPVWFGDRSLQQSTLAPHAEGAIVVPVTDFLTGDLGEPRKTSTEHSVDETELLPQAHWITPSTQPRELAPDEVAARRVLLSGGYSTWLDDGEWIRAVDPSQPGGRRVLNVDVKAVRVGIYLLLRHGETERSALYKAALELMGSQAAAVIASQTQWKSALQAQLDRLGRAGVVRELAAAGVGTLDRVVAWTEPMLARPRSDQDFERLLEWLGIDVYPAYELATALRRKRAQASVKIGDQLEEAVAAADMSLLERSGHLRLELESKGFRSVFATRVLGISPYVEIISRHETRILSRDRSAKWLE